MTLRTRRWFGDMAGLPAAQREGIFTRKTRILASFPSELWLLSSSTGSLLPLTRHFCKRGYLLSAATGGLRVCRGQGSRAEHTAQGWRRSSALPDPAHTWYGLSSVLRPIPCLPSENAVHT